MNGLLSVSASADWGCEGGFEIDNQLFAFVQAVGYLDHVSAGGTYGNGFRFQLLSVLDPYETFPGRGFYAGFGDDVSLLRQHLVHLHEAERLGWDCQHVIAFQREDRYVGCQAWLQFQVGIVG